MSENFIQAFCYRLTRRNTAIDYLLVWPAFNVVFIIALLTLLNKVGVIDLPLAFLRLWLIFFLLWFATCACYAGLDNREIALSFWQKMALNITLAVGCLLLVRAIIPRPLEAERLFFGGYIITALQMGFYVSYQHSLEVNTKNSELKMALKEAQMQMMRSRFNPHFVFNTLTLIANEIPNNPGLARDIVYDFSDLLRQSFNAAGKNFIDLNQELKLAQDYLAIQKKRFGDRLIYAIEINVSDTQILVPSLITQPLIENAIKHAVAPFTAPTHIVIEVNAAEEDLYIRVINSVHGSLPASFQYGDGLSMVKNALSLNAGDASRLSYEVNQNQCCFTLRLPIIAHHDEGIEF